MIETGSSTPWGAADSVTKLGPHVYSVGTPSHGGLFLGTQAVKALPQLVVDTFINGPSWAEEDLEATIAIVILDAAGHIDRNLLSAPIETFRKAAEHTTTTYEEYKPAHEFMKEALTAYQWRNNGYTQDWKPLDLPAMGMSKQGERAFHQFARLLRPGGPSKRFDFTRYKPKVGAACTADQSSEVSRVR